MNTKFFYFTLFMFCSLGLFAQTGKMKPSSIGKATYMREIPALSKMDNIISAKGKGHKAPPKRLGTNTFVPGKGFVPSGGIDPLVAKQKNFAQRAASDPVASFDAHSGTVLNDPTGAIGPNHYVYAFNSGFGILDRNGNVLMPEASLGTLFPGETLGDPVVVYDNFAERFLIMEFTNKPNGVLVAVSKGPDPVNDGWYTFRFPTGSFPDYVKLSIWNDGYYLTANKNSGGQTNFDVVFALERDKMLVGDDSAGIIGFPLPAAAVNGFYSPGGSNATGRTLPPAGTGHSILYLQDDSWSGVSSDHIKLWTTDVNWANPDSSTISQPQEISTAPFDSVFDGGSFQNLDEPGNGPDIDAIQATMMYMTNYRRFGTHNSIVFNFTVDINGSDSLAGIRWYELRQTADGQPWTIYQEGTYTQPNGLSAFCGSIAQDAQGNIGLGYTVVSSSVYTSLRYTGRLASDPLSTMTVAEGVSANGDAQTNRNDGRYGDYSHITIDPLDDMTFWHIGEYMKNPAPNVRRSHVVAFKLGSNTPIDTQAPTAPTNLAASGTTSVQTTLRWNASTDNIGVTGYDVLQDGVVVATVTSTSATITSLTAATTYTFSVIAKDAAGNESAASNVVRVTTTGTGSDTQAPTAPTNLAASGTTSVQTTLRWNASTDNIGVTGYDVLQDGVVVATVRETTATVIGLTQSTTYEFTIVALDAAGNESTASNVVRVTTTTTGPDTQAPTTPANLAASGTTNIQTTLTWSASTDNIGVTAYEVLQEEVVVATVTGTTATITGLTANTTYAFSVIALDAAGNESAASNVIRVTTSTTGSDTQAPTAPTNLVASNTTGISTTISWNASTDNVGVTGYDLIQDGILIGSVSSTTFEVSELAENTSYDFTVVAKDAAGNKSPASAVLTVTTTSTEDTQAPTAPSSLVASGTTETQTQLSWEPSTDNVGVTGYDVLQNGVVVTTVTATNTTIRGLTAATTYTFSIIAKDAAGNKSEPSNSETVTTLGNTPTPGCSNGLTFPYRESFETGFRGWTQGSGDDLDWEPGVNVTPSPDTGPLRAVDGNYYLYVEASGNGIGFPNKRAILNSPCFDLTGATSATFAFGYHMFGAPDFGGLAVDASKDGGVSWTRVWLRTGNQGSSWNRATIDLSAFVGGGVKLRFNRLTGGSWRADAAIDDLLFTTTGSGPGNPGGNCATPNLNLRITFDRYPRETSWALRNASGRIIASKAYSNAYRPGSTVVEPLNGVPEGNYTFTIYDSFGNGLCCFSGSGSYTLSSSAGTIVSGAQFRASESTRFCIGGRAEATKLVTHQLTDIDGKDSGLFKVYPNPATEVINIAVDKIAIQKVEIFSMYGQRVYQGVEKQIDISKFQAGIYFARITGSQVVVTREFAVK